MSGLSTKNFNLPWHQHDHYWISFYAKTGEFPPAAVDCLKKAGFKPIGGQGMGLAAGREWNLAWDKIYAALKAIDTLPQVEACITPGEQPPEARIESDCKAPVVIQMIAESLWLGEALLEDRIVCYLQPVLSTKDKVFGYESFARVKTREGKIIGGDQIIAASKVLGIEYMIDRHLHVQAIRTFVSSEFNGFLFVNFFPGFIHRPAVYLEGLSETAKSFGVISKHIVLDFTNSETPRDLVHLKSVCDYGRSRGYSVALDDISSVEVARKLVSEIRPDFVKVDMHLVRQVMDQSPRETIRTIVELAHAAGATVIAEGVETDDVFQALRSLGVDLFQGYLFSPPVPVEAALKRSGGGAAT
jgi:EAL domain-containing protein (putative c-di-GMP-specific phosphodiesterase class I)